jgi:hypothetical protein
MENPNAPGEALARQFDAMERALQPIRLNAKGIGGRTTSQWE